MTAAEADRPTQAPGVSHGGAALTVRDLVSIPHLGTRLEAGAGGLDRVISWAHACELDTPWEWLEPGDLLMTMGLGVPEEPSAQVEFIANLARSGVAGIAFADEVAPPLSDALVEAAEKYDFPLMFTAWSVPFGQLSRAVAAANSGPQLGTLVRVTRIYDQLVKAVSTQAEPLHLLRQLGDQIRCALYVCDRSGHAAFGPEGELPEELREVFIAVMDRHEGKLPGFLRVPLDDESLIVLPIPTRMTTALLAVPREDVPPYAVLQHVATAAALQLERMWRDRAEQRRLGTETVTQLMRGRLIQGTSSALRRLGLSDRPLVQVAMRHDDPAVLGDFHHALASRGVPNGLLSADELLYALLPAGDDLVPMLAALIPEGTRVGISDVFDDPTHVPTAAEEAKWALSSSTAGRPIVQHGDGTPFFGARSRTEAAALVYQVLNPLLRYDEANDTELVPSLRTFLECNRSWKDAAARLFVHKQTLVYRIKRVEELTGRSLSDTADVVDLWLALRAYEIVGSVR